MVRYGTAFRGQPLLLLGAVLGAWIAGRALLWEPPFPSLATPSYSRPRATATTPSLPAVQLQQAGSTVPGVVNLPSLAYRQTLPSLSLGVLAAQEAEPAETPRGAVEQNLLLFGGLAELQLPPPVQAL